MNINIENPGVIMNDDLIIAPKVTSSTKKAKNSVINYIKVKRILDIIIASIGLVVLSPIFLLLAIIIKIDSKGPVFFTHIRVGKNGKKFRMYKFRTMCENAQKMIRNFNPEQKKEFEENYKLRNDPRITRIGKFLRKTSLDELPQIINIIKGDLSIIGPRPITTKELRKYGKDREKFLSVTPGLTGYWQVNGRSDTSYEERIEKELYYIDNMSFKLDVEIFIKKIEGISYSIIKRIIDIIGSLFGLIILIPIIIVVWMMRKVLKEDDGPLIFKQLRFGIHGKQFKVYKLRTMCMDADKKLEEYLNENEEARKQYQKYKKLEHDPRITKVGKVIRKGSIDEFTQFWNVLKGEMSLVGPRPYLIKEKEDMGDAFNTITSVKPGITGYWQVNGRSDVTFEERIEMEKYYAEHKSLWLDTKIFFKTFIVIFKRDGAV